MSTHSSSRAKRQCSPLDRRIRKRQRTEQQQEEEASGSEAPPVERKHRSSDRGKKRESGSAVSSEGPPIKRKRRRSGRGKKKKSRTERDWYDRKWVCSPRDCSGYKGEGVNGFSFLGDFLSTFLDLFGRGTSSPPVFSASR